MVIDDKIDGNFRLKKKIKRRKAFATL